MQRATARLNEQHPNRFRPSPRRAQRRRRKRGLSFEPLEDRLVLAITSPFELSSLLPENGGDGSAGFVLNGVEERDFNHRFVSGAGDVNGDGFDDLIVGTTNNQSYVVFGKSTGIDPVLELDGLDGTNGFAIDSGFAVSRAGDVNGDGFDDVIVGVWSADPGGRTDAGASYVILGHPGEFDAVLELASVNGTNGFAIHGIDEDDQSGWSVSAGDVNGDGFDDVIIGAYNADPDGKGRAGESYVVFGKADEYLPVLELSSLDGTNGFVINGVRAGDFSGFSVGTAGDVNGDGIDDLIIGAILADPNGVRSAGESYVVFGKRGGYPAALELSSLKGTDGFAINGIADLDRSGLSVSGAGDLNADGFDDMVIGAPLARGVFGIEDGESYVVFGKAGGFDAFLEPNALDGTNGFLIRSTTSDANTGRSVSAAGDINGDGIDDLLIGTLESAAYALFGTQGGFDSVLELASLDGTDGFPIYGVTIRNFAGTAVSGAGDVNGDGFDDVLIGSNPDNVNGPDPAGHTYLVFGGDFAGGTTHVGAAGGEVLVGDGEANVMIGGTGADTLVGGGGKDVLRGGEGDDVLAVAEAAFARIVGGNGNDTLRLDGGGIHLDLPAIPDNRITGVEWIDLTGSGANTLTLNMLEVLNLSDESNTLTVFGDVDDQVDIGHGWTRSGTGVIDWAPFAIFTQGAATLKVSAAVSTTGPTVFELSSLLPENGGDGTTGFLVRGDTYWDYFSLSVSGAGDLDHDGFDDVVIGAAGASRAYAILGKAAQFPSVIDLRSLDGTSGFAINRAELYSDYLGESVSSAGDVNGDGLDDIILGAPGEICCRAGTGKAYVVFGKSPPFADELELSSLDGTNGFVINGVNVGDDTGESVSSAGDMNGDGFHDIIIGSRGGDYSYVVFGRRSFAPSLDLAELDGTNGFALRQRGHVKNTVSTAGDVNGDGFDDVILGSAPASESYVVFGKALDFAPMMDLAALDGTDGFVINETHSRIGASGDLNGDGFDDVVLEANDQQRTYVVFGKASGFAASIDPSSLDGTNGFVFLEDRIEFVSVSTIGDFNGDGNDDLAIGSPGVATNGSAGETYVIFGNEGSFPATLTRDALDGQAGMVVTGTAAGDRSGVSVSTARDVNGDGFDDLVIGAPNAVLIAPPSGSAGETYVVFGRDFSGAVTHRGDAGDDVLVGDVGANVIIGGTGADTLVGGGGKDVLRGGEGDDVLAVADAAFARIVGGNGTDTLRLDGGGIHLDLPAIPDNRITGIEQIDITHKGSNTNTLTLDVLEVLNVSDESNKLVVYSTDGDSVDIGDGWISEGVQEVDGQRFQVFTQGAAVLWISGTPAEPRGSIAGQGFEDLDGDGLRDTGEPILDGWLIRLLDGDGNLIEEQLTSANDLDGNGVIDPPTERGVYRFTGLAPGNYEVREEAPEGWVQKFPESSSYPVNLSEGQALHGLDFGNFRPVTVSGTKFLDQDGDGVRDAAEPGLAGWGVELDLDSDGSVDVTTLTDANGNYSFHDVGPGTHKVREVQQPGFVQTFPTGDGTYTVPATSGADVVGLDFGNFETIAISGTSFLDQNGDALRDAAEPGLVGWTIQLDLHSDGTVDATAVTDSDGNYLFTDVGPGSHTLGEVRQSGFAQTFPTGDGTHAVTATSGTDVAGLDFGNFETVTLSGTKFLDQDGDGVRDAAEPGLAGWTIQLDLDSDGTVDATTTTDANGEYRFADVGSPDSEAQFTVPGTSSIWLAHQPDGATIAGDVAPGHSPVPIDLAAFTTERFLSFEVSGQTSRDPHLESYPLVVGDGETPGTGPIARENFTTGAFFDVSRMTGPFNSLVGAFFDADQTLPVPAALNFGTAALRAFATLSPELQQVFFIGDGLTGVGVGDRQSFEIPAGADILYLALFDIENNNNIGALEVKVGGVTPLGGAGAGVGIGPGTHTLAEVQQPGYVQTFPAGDGKYTVTVSSGQDVSGLDFGNFHDGTTLSGTKFLDVNGDGVRDPTEPGLAGWTIELDLDSDDTVDTTTLTDGNGDYLFADVRSGSHKLREVQQPGFVQTFPNGDGTHAVTATSGTDVAGLDFGNFKSAALSGTKFLDRNADGLRDPADPGLANWTIQLDLGSDGTVDATTTTDANGEYQFSGVAPGTHTLAEVQQPSYRQSFPNGNGTHSVTVTSGADVSALDFGNFKTGTVSGAKFLDRNADGLRDPADPGLANWTIQLDLGSDGTVDATTTTDANGEYQFSGVAPGSHTIAEVQQPGYRQSFPNDIGTHSVIVTSGADVSALDFGNFRTVTLSGTKFLDRNADGRRDLTDLGLANWTIQLDLGSDGTVDATTTTDANGEYQFSGVAPGTHTIAEVQQPGYRQSSPNGNGTHSVTVTSGADISALDFGNFKSATLSGTKFLDRNADGLRDPADPGLANWTIELDLGSDGTVDATATTDANGDYQFSGVAPGTHTLAEVQQPGYRQSFPNSNGTHSVTVFSGAELSALDFGNVPQSAPALVDGNVWRLRAAQCSTSFEIKFLFGLPGDVPVIGDWNGDGLKTPGVFRNGLWFLRNSNTSGPGEIAFEYGLPGDVPVVGDWDGDGVDTPGIFRGGLWFLRNRNTSGVGEVAFRFGLTGDQPIVGDWDGNGTDTAGVVRDGIWFLRNSNTSGPGELAFPYGLATDRPVVGDWDGDGTDTPGIVRQSSTEPTQWMFRNQNNTGTAQTLVRFNDPNGTPLTWSPSLPIEPSAESVDLAWTDFASDGLDKALLGTLAEAPPAD